MNLKNIIESNHSEGKDSAFICVNKKDYKHLIESFERDGVTFQKTGQVEPYEQLLTDFLIYIPENHGVFAMTVNYRYTPHPNQTAIYGDGSPMQELHFYARDLDNYLYPEKSPFAYKDWHTYNITNWKLEMRN